MGVRIQGIPKVPAATKAPLSFTSIYNDLKLEIQVSEYFDRKKKQR